MSHRMNDQQKCSLPRTADNVPSLFAIYHAVLAEDRVDVFENQLSIFKSNAMDLQISCSLPVVPLKSHLARSVTTKMLLQEDRLLAQHPRIFTPTALRRVHHQRPALQRHPSQTT